MTLFLSPAASHRLRVLTLCTVQTSVENPSWSLPSSRWAPRGLVLAPAPRPEGTVWPLRGQRGRSRAHGGGGGGHGAAPGRRPDRKPRPLGWLPSLHHRDREPRGVEIWDVCARGDRAAGSAGAQRPRSGGTALALPAALPPQGPGSVLPDGCWCWLCPRRPQPLRWGGLCAGGGSLGRPPAPHLCASSPAAPLLYVFPLPGERSFPACGKASGFDSEDDGCQCSEGWDWNLGHQPRRVTGDPRRDAGV